MPQQRLSSGAQNILGPHHLRRRLTGSYGESCMGPPGRAAWLPRLRVESPSPLQQSSQ